MSNRQIAVLVLIGAFAAIGALTYVFFIKNVSELRVAVEGPSTARVSLMKGNSAILSAECPKDCTLAKIPPFDYELVVEAEGFVKYSEYLSIRNNDKIYREISLSRDVTTEAYREDRKEAIAEIRAKRAILSETGALEAGREYLGQYRGFDYYDEKVPNFRLVERSADGEEKVLFATDRGEAFRVLVGDGGLLWVEAGGASSLFDLETGDRDYPPFPSGITKVAKTYRNGYLVATDKDSAYAYQRETKSFDKNRLYSDFLPLPDGKVVALVKKGDGTKASLLNLGNPDRSYVFADRGAGDRKVLYSTDRTISNLHSDSGSVILEFEDGSKEVLKNYE